MQLPQSRFDHQYGSDSTTNLLLSEMMDLSCEKTVLKFLVGCSVVSIGSRKGVSDLTVDSICFLLTDSMIPSFRET
ncbi:hypothetical protein LINPERHAP2_LOCUS4722 [Linum perenne]